MLLRALRFIAKEINDRADEELNSEELVHQQMTESYALLETGAISEEEFERREQGFVARLQEIEARRKAREGDEEEADAEDAEDEEAAGDDADEDSEEDEGDEGDEEEEDREGEVEEDRQGMEEGRGAGGGEQE